MTPTPAMTAIVTSDNPDSGKLASGAAVGQTESSVPSEHVNDDTVTVGCTLASTVTPGVAAAICCASAELGVMAIVTSVLASVVRAVPDEAEAAAAGSATISTAR